MSEINYLTKVYHRIVGKRKQTKKTHHCLPRFQADQGGIPGPLVNFLPIKVELFPHDAVAIQEDNISI